MDKQQLIIKIRTKKLGLLLMDARSAMQRSPEDCAQVMSVTVNEYLRYETGELAPSIPQLESLACFLNVPVQHFWSKESLSTEGIWDEGEIEQRLESRNHFIGAHLRQAREDAGMRLEELAERTSIDLASLQEFEDGQKPVPVPLLETLIAILPIEMSELFDSHGLIGKWHLEQEALQVVHELSEPIRDFISKPVNFPYIELAMRLSAMPTEKLRTIAESLLEITY